MKIVLLAVLAAAAAAQVSITLPSETRLDIDSVDMSVEMKDASLIGSGRLFPSQRKAGFGFVCYLPLPANTWKQVGIRFTPVNDGKVTLVLMSKYFTVDKTNAVIVSYWDGLEAEGAVIANPDFEDVDNDMPRGWLKGSLKSDTKLQAIANNDPRFVKNGRYSIRVWHDSKFTQVFTVKAGVPVTIKGWAYVFDGSKPTAMTVDLSAAANMALADGTAGDEKGGWADQGRANDLSALPTGDRTHANIPFFIGSGDKACIVLKAPKRPYFPEKVTLAVPKHAAASGHVYLLHATAYTPKSGVGEIGRIIPVYAKGEGTPVSVLCGRDVADWWGAATLSNGFVGYTAENGSSYIGLYVSRFSIRGLGGDLTALRFESANIAVWGIAGVTLSHDEISLPHNGIYTTAPSGEWVPIKTEKIIVDGSALDLSHLIEKPAGKYGFLTAKDGRFVFENNPSVPLRFAGTHISWFNTNFFGSMSREEIIVLAKNVAKMGYNCARFQYIDNAFFSDRSDPSTYDPIHTDKLDFLFSELKKNGVYMTMDLNWSRGPRTLIEKYFPGLLAKGVGWHDLYNSGYYIIPEFREELRSYARQVLSHVNPYTGLAWKDDPVLIYIGTVNEDPLEINYSKVPEAHALYEKSFNKYLAAQYKSSQELSAAWGDLTSVESLERGTVALPRSLTKNKRGADACRFLVETQAAGYEEMRSFLRGIGCRQPIGDCNMVHTQFTTLLRRNIDFVDQHAYWDHSKGLGNKEWDLPYGFHGRSALKPLRFIDQNYAIPCYGAYFATTRNSGKPYFVSEYNFLFPNRHRSEGGLYFGAIAALQGWDGALRMGYVVTKDDVFADSLIKGNMCASDPISQATERQIKFLYLRGDMREAEISVSLHGTSDAVAENWYLGGEAAALSFIGKIGLSVGDSAPDGYILPLTTNAVISGKRIVPFAASPDTADAALWLESLKGGLIPAGNKSDLNRGLIETATREARFNFNEGTIAVNTPRTKGWVIKTNGTYEMPGVSAAVAAKECSLTFSSLDGSALSESRRVLIMFPTDAINTGMKFGSDERTVLIHWGGAPVLVRVGSAAVTFRNDNRMKLFALSTTGRRTGEVPAHVADGNLKFTLAHGSKEGVVLNWELAAE
ncbi:MAG: hypothetical protein AABZ39_10575 [Spirochaetota bacterium]